VAVPERLREACGVFGVVSSSAEAAPTTFDGLYALQHRGQESAGIAVSDGHSITVYKDMGLVSQVFDERKLAALPGRLAIGHTRYSTSGRSDWAAAQPVFRSAGGTSFALGHNGNLTNTLRLASACGLGGDLIVSDSELIAELLARELASLGGVSSLLEALLGVLPRLEGAYSLVLMDTAHLYGARDPHGFRPLCVGRLGDGWVLASETPALDVVGAEFVREVEPGEVVIASANGLESQAAFPPEAVDPRLCVFEFVYFARPDARLYGKEVHAARRRMGELLAEVYPVEADLVVGVPDSGLPAAEGYARRSGIPFGHALVKNRYIGRTFIAPEQRLRDRAVRRKLNPLSQSIAGRRLVLVDDSVVRGTTTKALVSMLREAGAREVHLRVSSPPYLWPCRYGIDTPERSELLAAVHSSEEIVSYLGADSVAYLRLDQLYEAIGQASGFCDACLTGRYPVPYEEADPRALGGSRG
jgi:amidophosphoribosyltransferase